MKNAFLMEKIASDRIKVLLNLAEVKTLDKQAGSARLAKRYVGLAKRVSMHYGVGIPKELKQRICRNCGNFLVPGANCSVKLASSHGYLAYLCECGAERHIFYKKKN